jgi:hypothetical protein
MLTRIFMCALDAFALVILFAFFFALWLALP